MPFNVISMIGLGYIGLPTAEMFAARRKNVVDVNINPKTVDITNAGNIHVVELDVLVRAAVSQDYLRTVTQPELADVFLVAVTTSFIKDSDTNVSNDQITKPDLSDIESAGKVLTVEPNIQVLLEKQKGKFTPVAIEMSEESASIEVLLVGHREFKLQAGSGLSTASRITDTKGVF